MRIEIAVGALALACSCAAYAEDMVSINNEGLMCRNEKALALFTKPDGSQHKKLLADQREFDRFLNECEDSLGITVHVLTKRKNTSIVTFREEIWYVPNIDFMTPGPDCVTDGARVTLVGTIKTASAQTGEGEQSMSYEYPRLTLDKPICYLGNWAEKAGRYVSLLPLNPDTTARVKAMIGRHVAISGELTSPDNIHKPPDNMLMYDPAVSPVP